MAIAPDQVSLDGRGFSVAEMGEQGEASQATVFEYNEDGGVVWARYEGAMSASAFWSAPATATGSTSATANSMRGAKRRTVIAPPRSSCYRMDEFA